MDKQPKAVIMTWGGHRSFYTLDVELEDGGIWRGRYATLAEAEEAAHRHGARVIDHASAEPQLRWGPLPDPTKRAN